MSGFFNGTNPFNAISLVLLIPVIGAALLIETAALGGGEVGFLSGAVFVVLGILRWRAMNPRGKV
jgi:hypothetical protein